MLLHEDVLLHEDSMYMKMALKEARKAYKKKEVPVGAVIVHNNTILASAHNRREQKQDATEHAELAAIKKACRRLATWRLNECTLYVTLEPCAMCAGAIIQARIRRVVIGAKDPKAGAAGSVINILQNNLFNHNVQMAEGILETECSAILRSFFQDLRNAKFS